MKLHEAMVEVLERHGGGWMNRDEIAREIAADGLYIRPSDGAPPPSDQLRLRARSASYAHLLECSDKACSRIRLRARNGPSSASAPVPTSSDQERDASSLDEARSRREQAALRYRPESINLLLVAEAPPSALERYFYFEDVREQDSLFRYVVRAILGKEPTREGKAALLAELRDEGVFMIDLKPDPVDDTPLAENVSALIDRIRDLSPDKVILVKATVFDAAYTPLSEAGMPVIDERIPFPGSGQQRRFEEAMSRALKKTPTSGTG